MKVTLDITSCETCPYEEDMYHCTLTKGSRKIEDPKIIPDWCPLKYQEEQEEKDK